MKETAQQIKREVNFEIKNILILKHLANYSSCFVYAHIECIQTKETRESERLAIPWESVAN